MMTNLQAVLKEARLNRYAIGSFNVYNYETIRGVIESGQELKLPTIVAFGENYLNNMELAEVAGLVRTMAHNSDVPVVLHLDHCKSFATIVQAIKAGFTSVMYDGSNLPFQENMQRTARIVEVAHAAGVSVEAELGALACGKFSNEADGAQIYTDPAEALEFSVATSIDALAVSIGTVHGMYKGTPQIKVNILKEIAAAVNIPLVLHGGSGTPEELIQECIITGIAKINVNTEISVQTVEKLKGLLASGNYHLSQLSLQQVDCVKEVVKKYMTMFRTTGVV